MSPRSSAATGSATDAPAARSPRRQRRRERNQAELRDAARECFRTHGYFDATIAEITARADVAHGTFYNYYETKDEVFTEIVDELLDELFSVVHDIGAERSIRTRLRLGIGALLERCAADRGIVLALLQASHVNALYEERWRQFRDRLRRQVERDLGWLNQRRLTRQLVASTTAVIITRMVEGVALEVVTNPAADVAALTDGVVDIYWDSIFRPIAGGEEDLIIDG